jgi:hypothetical protein
MAMATGSQSRQATGSEPQAEFYCPRGPGPNSPFMPPMNGAAHWRGDGHCSFCGSLSPESLFEAITLGETLTPTDKSYKVYVEICGRREKFYFQHLSKDEQERFIDMLNAGSVTIGFPGYFYQLPFFATRDRNNV